MTTTTSVEFCQQGFEHRLANEWSASGSAFMNAAYASTDDVESASVASYFVEAGNSFARENVTDAVDAYKRAISIFITYGRFGMAAGYYKRIAVLYETSNKIADAIQAYEQAANFYDKDSRPANKCEMLLKVAYLEAEYGGHLILAAELFEIIAKESLTSRLGAFVAKGYFYHAMLCYLAAATTTLTTVSCKLAEFKACDRSFAVSRECALISKLLRACETNDDAQFDRARNDFDQVAPFSGWETKMLDIARGH